MRRMPPRPRWRPRRLSSGEKDAQTPERSSCDVIIVDHDTERSAARRGEDIEDTVISGSASQRVSESNMPEVVFMGVEESPWI